MSATSVTSEAAATTVAADPSQSQPTSASARTHWAAPMVKKPEPVAPATAAAIDPAAARRRALEQKFEAMRDRNWITDRMVQQYQKHWNCSREAALERLLSKTGS
jgi:hypothetical protein